MTIEIDIHGMVEYDAIKYLEKTLASLNKDVREVIVIHGFNKGNVLKEMVRNPNKLRSKKIIKRKITMNQGQTILVIG
ncbi:hypothetical protein CI105_04035 [Candidatus Izimaplasma bacterium ZiA1]|uniref:Smr/MutS family protein n=1 Tax=Candidatus Izimoplasma sp. ZiA1 TaxID=2024899 RepID=UPI000BAA8E1B|nr:hypothetical protein CI105_04035 [Candidatus Izimaplasma bacterium ZiA1]